MLAIPMVLLCTSRHPGLGAGHAATVGGWRTRRLSPSTRGSGHATPRGRSTRPAWHRWWPGRPRAGAPTGPHFSRPATPCRRNCRGCSTSCWMRARPAHHARRAMAGRPSLAHRSARWKPQSPACCWRRCCCSRTAGPGLGGGRLRGLALAGHPGQKRLLALRVVDAQGRRLGVGRALLRHLAAGLSWLSLNLGMHWRRCRRTWPCTTASAAPAWWRTPPARFPFG